jgi:hypothetical protein
MSVSVRGGKLISGSMGGKLSQRVEHFENEVDKRDGRKEYIHYRTNSTFALSLSLCQVRVNLRKVATKCTKNCS